MFVSFIADNKTNYKGPVSKGTIKQMNKEIVVCEGCKKEFEISKNTPTEWIASGFEGEDILVYRCPYCEMPSSIEYKSNNDLTNDRTQTLPANRQTDHKGSVSGRTA